MPVRKVMSSVCAGQEPMWKKNRVCVDLTAKSTLLMKAGDNMAEKYAMIIWYR